MPDPSNGTEEQDKQLQDQDAAAESSTADDDGAKSPGSMLDAVTAALETKEPAPEPPTGKQEEGEAGAEGKAEGSAQAGDESGEAEGDEGKPPPFHEHPRWQAMLAEKKQLEEPAKRWGEFEQQLKQSGLSMDDVSHGAELMRLVRDDPAKFAEVFAPVMEQVQRFNGQGSLPEDLAADVEAGRLTEDRARELAQLRTQKGYLEGRTKEDQERAKREADERAQNDAVKRAEAVKGAVNEWEDSWKKSDPDFEKKHRRVRDRVFVLARELGRPIMSAEEAVQLADKAREEVEQELGTLLPPKESKRGPTKGGSSVSTAPEPKSLRDAVDAALSRG